MNEGYADDTPSQLDDFIEKYLLEPSDEIENDLILNWYPKRIIDRTGQVNSLLELGLGHGYTIPYFLPICENHVVVEGSRRLIEHYKSKNSNYSGQMDLAYFETYEPSMKFDAIVMGFILEHVDDPVFILKRYGNFLKPGGRIFVAVPNAKSLNRRFGLAMGLIENIYDLNENDIKFGHQRNFCRATLAETVRQAGYVISHEEGIYLKPLPLGVLKTMSNLEANMQAMLEVGVEFPDLCVALLLEIEIATYSAIA